jgi:hypothetical protein
MTEKLYGGASSFGAKDKSNLKNNMTNKEDSTNKSNKKKLENKENPTSNNIKDINKYIEAGKISSEVKEFAKSFINKV